LPPPNNPEPPTIAEASAKLAPMAAAPREFTARGLLLGSLLAIILGAANAYLGLYAGMTVSASIPAAVISMAVLRILGGATVLENNVVQTIASAGEAVAAGAIFTFPALVILGRSQDLSYRNVTLLSAIGGAMGSLLIIVLRRAYIVEESLPYPEGKACAHVLRSGDAGAGGVRPLAGGAAIAAAFKVTQSVAGLIPDALSGARWFGRIALAGSVDLSAALLGVGYIVGIQIASMVLAGGAIAWFVGVPLLSLVHPGLHAQPAAKAASQLWNSQIRFLGVGAMLTGGLTTIWRMRSPIVRALADTRRADIADSTQRPREETDIAAAQVITALAICVVLMFAIYEAISGSWWMALLLAGALAVIGFFATSVAGYLTGLVGASNNPVSGVTLIVLLAIALILKFAGVNALLGPQLAILAGAVVCVAAAMAGDSLHDLATGFHLGATPRALEYAVLIGAIVSALVVAPILKVLISSYGIAGMPGAPPHALPAPQAFLMAQVVRGVFAGGLPWPMVAAGAGLALVLHLIDVRLQRYGSGWRTPPMPLAIGLYLPLGLSVTIAIGALIRTVSGNKEHSEADSGLLFSAGLIAGEALTGILIAALVTLGIKLPIW
jgi:putative OPT family oligopeptide transporter